MSFKFPSFDFKSIQESLPSVDQVKESFTKTSDQLSKSIQPYTTKTTQLISEQLKHLEQLANNTTDDIDVSELPQDYLQLESNCDLLLKLYTDLIQTTNETYGKVSYDYPPELEKVLLGQDVDAESKDESGVVSIQPTSPQLPKTLFGHLAEICAKHSDELKSSEHPLSFALLQVSSTYQEIAVARLDQDKKIMSGLNAELIRTLNESFIKVNELRKKLIAKEDGFVSATEVAVVEMKKLLKPSKNIDLLKVLVAAQKDYFEVGAKKLKEVLDNLDKIPTTGEEEEDD
ncbi:Bin/amphiphysin/Rvs domain for vesicular trafficking family protein [Candida albicans]|uniref:Bin/amphiphysin/Rvs domain for vesicular trafficking family protein n=1 Tax=Candida albicans TaxID=5476 RepID=A0A8H6BSB0_CANAX|nr:Bin/amphiphysin/Rvs domain for vesicular trafficking family protein [Candida albicans]